MRDDIVIEDAVIPARELKWSFSTSGGPGGQHANRSFTRVELRFDVAASRAFDDATVKRLLERLAGPLVVVRVDETRSQWRNRQIARRRLTERIETALRPGPAPRKATRPGRAARRRRLDEKRARSRTKRLRRPPAPEQ